jgi:predicted TIM-barrel fold metal-dependent hydrolase
VTPRWSVEYQQPDRPPDLPIPPGPVSNGEFLPREPNRRDHDLYQATLSVAEQSARHAGMDRRRFLQTAGGVAATLAVFNLAACSSGANHAARGRSPGGTFRVPAPSDVAACEHALATPDGFVFDVHTHHVIPNDPWRDNAPETVQLVLGMLPPDCMAADKLECVNRANYLHDIFLASDTTVALLSDVPNSGPQDAPIPFSEAISTQSQVAQLAPSGAPRMLLHNVIAPNFGDLNARLADMATQAATGHVAGFKVYTAWGPNGQGFSLEDPHLGLPVIQQAHDTGVKVFTAHKGLPLMRFDAAHNGPDDIVAVSRQFPDMNFVVFHGAWDPNHREGPYDPTAAFGIDTFLHALDVHQVPPNANVWVDLGTVWRQLLSDPDQAAHAVGKLLTRVGDQRVLWGTDAVWYGSPQPQLMAFRAFEITAEYQERFGYPALTDTVKGNVLGLNAAQLFHVDPTATRCALATDPLTTAQAQAAELRADGALPSPWKPRGPTTRRELLRWLRAPTTRWTPT